MNFVVGPNSGDAKREDVKQQPHTRERACNGRDVNGRHGRRAVLQGNCAGKACTAHGAWRRVAMPQQALAGKQNGAATETAQSGMSTSRDAQPFKASAGIDLPIRRPESAARMPSAPCVFQDGWGAGGEWMAEAMDRPPRCREAEGPREAPSRQAHAAALHLLEERPDLREVARGEAQGKQGLRRAPAAIRLRSPPTPCPAHPGRSRAQGGSGIASESPMCPAHRIGAFARRAGARCCHGDASCAVAGQR